MFLVAFFAMHLSFSELSSISCSALPVLIFSLQSQVDPKKQLVKGGGGALLREKMIEARAKKLVIIVDASKRCSTNYMPYE
jgi:ribose 5-phosphate isomerase